MPESRPVALVAPLDWGLGHATRCMPVIRELISLGWEVILAADRSPLLLLREAFPQLEFIRLPGAHIVYPRRGGVVLHFVWQTPGFLRSVRQEHQDLQKILRSRRIDLVISDNRYGLYSRKVPCVLISHQLRIRVPGVPVAETFVSRFVKYFAARFRAVWVPDWSGPDNLSGLLSGHRSAPSNVRYIGPLSRFAGMSDESAKVQEEPSMAIWDQLFDHGPFPLLFLVSGPEPAVSVFRKLLREQALRLNLHALMVLGQPSAQPTVEQEQRLFSIGHLPTPALARALREAEVVICRSGYSSLMDLAVFGRKALLVPTPGQSEQVYLGERFRDRGWAHCVKQSRLDLSVDLPLTRSTSGITAPFHAQELRNAIAAVSKK